MNYILTRMERLIDQNYRKEKAYKNSTDQSYTQRKFNTIHTVIEDTEKLKVSF